MRFSIIFFLTGLLMMFFGALMLLPMTVDFFYQNGHSFYVFLFSATIVFLAGVLLSALSHRNWMTTLTLKEMFFSTSFIWFFMAFLGALPFYFQGDFSAVNAFFESVSGITTTGATIIQNLDAQPHGLLLWRSILQWLGGVGIVILAITFLPLLRVGGMQFFTTESSDISDKDSPFVTDKMKSILGVYLMLSALCCVCLYLAGMNFFDAVAHAMTTISTGGFSTHSQSIAFFDNPVIDWVVCVFMFLSSLPLLTFLFLMNKKWGKIKNDTQIKTFILFVFGVVFFSAGLLFLKKEFSTFLDCLREASFAIVSVVSTTGFVLSDYSSWGPFFVTLFFFLLMTGGCAGSTTGGIKMFRFDVLFKSLKRHLQLMLTPHAVIVPRYSGKPIDDTIISGVLSFMTIYFACSTLGALMLSLCGLDLVSSLSGAFTAISNVGPGLGSILGPQSTFFAVSDSAKMVMSVLMVLGRLEFMTLIVLFVPALWRKN